MKKYRNITIGKIVGVIKCIYDIELYKCSLKYSCVQLKTGFSPTVRFQVKGEFWLQGSETRERKKIEMWYLILRVYGIRTSLCRLATHIEKRSSLREAISKKFEIVWA